MQLEAFAKINWTLDITGVREDGYHLMDMLMQPVSIADEITLNPAPDIRITTGGIPRSRADETNLAWRAAQALKEVSGYPGGIAIHVHKTIPIGAGMGGGSADAAAVLKGLNQFWKIGLSQEELENVGLQLGADVPFLLRGGLARVRGIGEKMEIYDDEHNWWLVITQPCGGLSTARIFSLWKSGEVAHRPDTDRALEALQMGDLAAFSTAIGNVLQPAASSLRPEIDETCNLLRSLGASAACMTGSGSAVFGVFSTRTLAQKACQKLSVRLKKTFLCHSQHDSIRLVGNQEAEA